MTLDAAANPNTDADATPALSVDELVAGLGGPDAAAAADETSLDGAETTWDGDGALTGEVSTDE